MAQQGELFPDPETAIALNGARGEPRLWVSRLVIWEKPGVIIREVRLRRGLNIVWSPDPGAELADLGRDAGSGHGAGKTLFCRLLRYCLGEENFSNSELRKSIAEQLPAGLVGAEIFIAGKRWAVIRPIGLTRKHVAQEGASLEDIALMKDSGGSIQPLLESLESNLFPQEIENYLPGEHPYSAWLFALAWLSRDQECRFDHILDWRHRRADTGSIAVGPTKEQLLIVVRTLLGIIEQEEIRLKAQREELAEKKRAQERDLVYLQRQGKQLRSELIDVLGLGREALIGDDLGLLVLRETAEGNLREAEKQDTSEDLTLLETYRRQREEILSELAVIKSDSSRYNATREIHEQQLRVIKGERSNVDAKAMKALLGPICPICTVPIDRALAEGCGLSLSPWDPSQIHDEKQRLVNQTAACNEAISRIAALVQDCNRRRGDLDRAQAELVEKIGALENKIEVTRRDRRQEWFTAKQLVAKASDCQTIFERSDEARRTLDDLVNQDAGIANQEARLRDRHNEALSRFRDLFSYVCRGLLGNQVKASLSLSGQGLQADVEVGGMAMESLKAIAFDLAALLMSIENLAMLPAFLIHDSPREADLGEAIYHRLFRFARSVERLSDDPPFQYVITTTSRPPADLCKTPFVIVQLNGSEVDGRLLRRNLGGLTK